MSRAHSLDSVRAALTLLVMTAPAAAQSPDILMSRAPNRQATLIEGARQEGEVVIYSSMIVNQALRPLANAFMVKYPFVKMTYWRGDTEQIIAKVGAETRAGNTVVDVLEGTGGGERASDAGFAQPYVSPMQDAFPARYRDPAGMWTATRLSYFSLAYNTRAVAPADAPKSYDDLLDARWTGKMAWRIESASGTPLFLTNLRLAWGEDRAAAYFDKLAVQKIVNFGAGSARTLVDRVIAGEYPIALNIFAHHPLISKAKGAPVDSRLLDPTPATAATLLVAKGARHPNAAMLLVDFILSPEGQSILSAAEYFPSRPDVAPLEKLAPVIPSRAGVAENFIGPEALKDNTDASEAIFQKLFR